MSEDLRAYAATFPSQGGVEIGPWLERYARGLEPCDAIVEVGCWLGGGTAYLALGAMQSKAEIWTYDRFFCPNDEEKDKAARYGIKLDYNEDTLPRVQKSLAPFRVSIHYQKGSWRKFDWDKKKPIGLYVDDLTKNDVLWTAAMDAFLPAFIPGRTHLFLMDFYFYETAGPVYEAQKRYMAKNSARFEMLEDRLAGTTCALFRFLG